MKTLYLITLSFVLIFIGCKDKKSDRLAQAVSEWQGKEVHFPEEITSSMFSTKENKNAFFNSQYKIVVYVDSIGCMSCKLKLNEWNSFLNYINENSKHKIAVMFIFNSLNYQEISNIITDSKFNYPYYFDNEDKINKINNFPSEIGLQSFLLNGKNKVQVIGNPIHYPGIKELYTKALDIKQNQSKTDINHSDPNIDLGKIKNKESHKVMFQLYNTGLHPLIIENIHTDCGCIKVQYKQEPIPSNDSLAICIKITPEEVGFLSKSIIINCNSNISPIKLQIKGYIHD